MISFVRLVHRLSHPLDEINISSLFSALITGANIVIAVVLHRVSFRWSPSNRNHGKRDLDTKELKTHLNAPSIMYHSSTGSTATTTGDILQATKRRTNAQVTRMLLAVTLSLIICNIPNTIYFVFVKLYDTRQLFAGRSCAMVSDNEIHFYKYSFYSGVIQDILSDLPHIVNFFLYCLAGKKFRSIFVNEVENFLRELRLTKGKQRRFTQASTYACNIDSPTSVGLSTSNAMQKNRTSRHPMLYQGRPSMDLIYQGNPTSKTVLNSSTEHHQPLLRSSNKLHRFPSYSRSTRSQSPVD